VAERVTAKAGGDSYYQELLCQCEIKEIEYHRIICKLLPTEQEQVDDYVAVCEELEYRRTQLAYELGLEDGAREGR
jgi:hypothetical protein